MESSAESLKSAAEKCINAQSICRTATDKEKFLQKLVNSFETSSQLLKTEGQITVQTNVDWRNRKRKYNPKSIL